MNNMTLEIDGKEKIVDVVKMWTMNNVNYIAYTDGSETDGVLDLFVSKYTLIEGGFKLEPIENNEEWELVDRYLDNNLE